MLKAVNLLGLYVTNTDDSVSFYRQLGFEVISNDSSIAEIKLHGFRLQFVAKESAREMDESFQKDAFGEPKGTGMYINVEVEHIDAYYQQLRDSGIETSTEPRDWPWGHREFVVRDPDRYKLVFYEKLKT